jgi:hypothetical protein
MQNTILIFIHVAAAAIALGGTVLAVLLLPGGEKTDAIRVMDILAPTVFASLLALLGSGVYYLLENYAGQVNLKPGYYNIFGIKMLFAAAAFGLGTYNMFALRPRISDLDLRPDNQKRVPETLGTMAAVGKACLLALVCALFFGVWMARF